MNLNTEIVIRDWRKNDFPGVRNILLSTWKSTYTFIPENDVISHFEYFYNEKKLEEIYNNPDISGVIAEVNSFPAGWMKLYKDESAKRFYISSLYVLPQFQGIGLGKKLLLKACNVALNKNFDRVWLGVMNQNKNAIDWYKNFGFIFIEEEPFQMGLTNVLHLIGYKIIS